jgi:hypothetical protein
VPLSYIEKGYGVLKHRRINLFSLNFAGSQRCSPANGVKPF